MSDKLVVEFYSPEDLTTPVACVLDSYGGDNPSTAATTLSDFFGSVEALIDSRFYDASLLAARFVVWRAIQETDKVGLDFFGVCLIPFSTNYGYQVVRIYTGKSRPYVYFVNDEWTTPQELLEASMILRQSRPDPLFATQLGHSNL